MSEAQVYVILFLIVCGFIGWKLAGWSSRELERSEKEFVRSVTPQAPIRSIVLQEGDYSPKYMTFVDMSTIRGFYEVGVKEWQRLYNPANNRTKAPDDKDYAFVSQWLDARTEHYRQCSSPTPGNPALRSFYVLAAPLWDETFRAGWDAACGVDESDSQEDAEDNEEQEA